MKFSTAIFVSLLAFLVVARLTSAFKWNGNSATGCYFSGHDAGNVATTREGCEGKCLANDECTHYMWTSLNGGTCYMKKGSISKDAAMPARDRTSFCGIVTRSEPMPDF